MTEAQKFNAEFDAWVRLLDGQPDVLEESELLARHKAARLAELG